MKLIKPAPSIPTKAQCKEFALQSSNVAKIKQYQFDHFLEEVDQQKRIDKFTEQVPPLPCQFKSKKIKEIVTLPEFIAMENPPPFGGAQAVKEEEDDNINIQQYLQVKQLKQEQQKDRYSSIHEDNVSDTVTTIRNIQNELSKEHDRYFENFIKKLEEEKIEQKVQEYVKLPLPELLRIPNHFNKQKKDQYRAMSAKERKQVEEEHVQNQQVVKAEIPKKSLQEMEKMIEETKKDYFKIIRDLDMLNKGARQLKNATSQQYGIRKQVDPPNVDKLVKQVKDTIWYTEGLTNGFDRELALIQYKNSKAKNLVDINKLLDENQSEPAQPVISQPQPIIEKPINKMDDASMISQKTQSTVKSIPKVVNSKKAKELQGMMTDDLF